MLDIRILKVINSKSHCSLCTRNVECLLVCRKTWSLWLHGVGSPTLEGPTKKRAASGIDGSTIEEISGDIV